METNVFTDGCCINNGKRNARGGVGIYFSEQDCYAEKLPGNHQTNNRAELFAALRGIQIAKEKGIENLVVNTDSCYVINGIKSWLVNWKLNNWKTSGGRSDVLNKDLWIALDTERKGITVKWKHVRGHCGIPENEAADQLAKQGAQN